MAAMIRESPAGQMIRWVTGARLLKYPEELPGFELPAVWNAALNASEKPHTHPIQPSRNTSYVDSPDSPATPNDLEKEVTLKSTDGQGSESSDSNLAVKLTRTKTRTETAPWTQDRFEVEEELEIEKTVSKPIIPLKTSDGTVCLSSSFSLINRKLIFVPRCL